MEKCGEATIGETMETSSKIQVDSGERIDCENLIKNVVKLNVPYVGMIFDSIEEAKKYYEDYGHQEGFSIRIQTTSKCRRGSNEITGMTYVCTHQGKYKAKEKEVEATNVNESANKIIRRSSSTAKCGCKAMMRVTHDYKWTAKWKVSVFYDDHNHKVVTPSKRMKMRSNRCMPTVAKDLVETFRRENIQITKVSTILNGDLIGFDGRDCFNHLRNARHRELEVGDAQLVLNYFITKQVENPKFFYAIQCDDEMRAINFFWVDARSRLSYEYFGDAVTFDITHRTNKYDMPFALFTGVNHHFQSIQFGCAFLQDETEATLLWLFETWIKAMGGRHPISMITDQDLAIRNVIAEVFPNTRHCLSIWHIMKKFHEKLAYKYFEICDFKNKLERCIWSTYTGEEFEKNWKNLIVEHGLEGNEWLEQLFDLRESWVPVYNRSYFFAGMNTTSRRESINAFFDKFVTWKTNLREFVVKYEEALEKLVTNEIDEDFKSEHKFRCVKNDELLLKHAATVYTKNMFEKLREEWLQVNRFKVEEMRIDYGFHTYRVTTKFGESEEFVLKLNLDTHEGACECKKFEFIGIICRHFLKVFFRLDIDTIPSHFILERWRKGANKFRVMDSQVIIDGKEPPIALRFDNMCQQASALASFASPSMKAYEIFMNTLNELSKQISEVRRAEMLEHEAVVDASPALNMKCSNNLSQLLLLDPKISQTKDRKKDEKGKGKVECTSRLKSNIELSQQKKKRKCASCKAYGHDKRICLINSYKKRTCSTTQDNDDIQELSQDMESDHEASPLS